MLFLILLAVASWNKSIIMIYRPRNEFIPGLWILGFLLFQNAPACAQMAAERVDQIVYVNPAHPQASDQNPGSQALPFKTIGRAAAAAIANNVNQVSTKVLIAAGTYRESIALLKNGRETDAPIVFEAAGEVIVCGSDVWAGWQKVAGDNVLAHAWPYTWGLAPVPPGWEPHVKLQDIVRRSEMVFVNGTPLDQALSHSELQAGGFFADEKGRTIYVRLPEGLTVDQAVVEVAVRPKLFWASDRTNIVLRGIIFQYANTALDEPAVGFYDSSNIIVEDCRFRWNNWGGLGFGRSRNITACRNEASYNGGAGIGTYKTRTVVFEDNETSHNNWRGKKGGFTGWAVGGMKNLHMHGGLFLRHKSFDNQTHGIWFDTDCENILVSEAVFCSNLRHGIYLEANQGPITIQNSRIFRNKHYGILIANSAGVNLERNIIHGNAASQIMVSGLYDSARPETNWETGKTRALLAEQAAWIYNAFVGTEAKQLLVATTLSPPLWGHFVDSLMSDRNIWFNPQDSNVFQTAGGHRSNFNVWQSKTGQDSHSSFADPRFRDPANEDFQLLPDSPLLIIWRGASGPAK
jgi:parallel beta-helix repeat protein